MNSPLISMKSQTFVFGHLNMGIGSRCGAAGPGLPTCSKYRPFFKKVKTEKKIKKNIGLFEGFHTVFIVPRKLEKNGQKKNP